MGKCVALGARLRADEGGTPALLTQLALGRVQSTPYSADAVRQLKTEVEHTLEAHGHKVVRQTGDREDLPIDFRFLQALLAAAEDPEVSVGSFAQGVRVGPGAEL